MIKRHYKKGIPLLLFLFSILSLFSQNIIEKQISIGGSGADFGRAISQGPQKSYIISGYSNSTDADISQNKGGMDIFISLLDSNLNLKWLQTYGGSGNDISYSVISCRSGGYMMAGFSNSSDGDFTGNKGMADCFLMRLDTLGNLIWEKNYGGSANDGDIAVSVIETADSGFAVCSNTSSTDGDVSINHGSIDFWVFKTDSKGKLLWEKTYGGSKNEDSHTILEMKNGDLTVAGHSTSSDGDLSKNQGGEDFCIIRIDHNGNLLWCKTFGGTTDDVAYHLCSSDHGGIIACGSSNSIDGDISRQHGGDDCWILKIDSSGALEWEKTLGGSLGDYAMDISPNASGYAVSAYSLSSDGDLKSNYGSSDYWLILIDTSGNIISQNTFGGSGVDRAMAMDVNAENEITICGFTNSSDTDVMGNHGSMDCWAIKLKNSISVAIKNQDAKPNAYMCYYDTFNQQNIIVEKNELNCIDCVLKISDLSGKIILQKPIGEKLQIRDGEILSGLYIYTVVSGRKIISSDKILIK